MDAVVIIASQIDATTVARRGVAADRGVVTQRDSDLEALNIDSAAAFAAVVAGRDRNRVVGDLRVVFDGDGRRQARLLEVLGVYGDAAAVGLVTGRNVSVDLRVVHLQSRSGGIQADAGAALDCGIVRDLAVLEVEVCPGAAEVNAAATTKGFVAGALGFCDNVMGYGAVGDPDGRPDARRIVAAARADAAAVSLCRVVRDFAAVSDGEHAAIGVVGDSRAKASAVVHDLGVGEDKLDAFCRVLGADGAAIASVGGVADIAGERDVDKLDHGVGSPDRNAAAARAHAAGAVAHGSAGDQAARDGIGAALFVIDPEVHVFVQDALVLDGFVSAVDPQVCVLAHRDNATVVVGFQVKVSQAAGDHVPVEVDDPFGIGRDGQGSVKLAVCVEVDDHLAVVFFSAGAVESDAPVIVLPGFLVAALVVVRDFGDDGQVGPSTCGCRDRAGDGDDRCERERKSGKVLFETHQRRTFD